TFFTQAVEDIEALARRCPDPAPGLSPDTPPDAATCRAATTGTFFTQAVEDIEALARRCPDPAPGLSPDTPPDAA
ncbi:hypothetical protein CTI14_70430, partial [Methylobacterium radiotolerans]